MRKIKMIAVLIIILFSMFLVFKFWLAIIIDLIICVIIRYLYSAYKNAIPYRETFKPSK